MEELQIDTIVKNGENDTVVGMRGNPCKKLYAQYRVWDGELNYQCGDKFGDGAQYNGTTTYTPGNSCTPGEWCPIVGDPKYNIVPGK